MGKLRSIAFIAAFALICCSAGTNLVLSQLAPDVFRADNYLSGGSPASVSAEEIIAQPQRLLTDREFADQARDSIEASFGKTVPFHDSLLLANAGLQRQGIATANVLAGFELYPSYYGSNYVCDPARNVVTYIPEVNGEGFYKRLHRVGRGLAQQARKHSDTTFVMYLVPGKSTPGASALYEYMPQLTRPEEVMSVLEEELAGIDNLVLVTNSYSSADKYYEDYFRTDHHWNARGAARAYNTIAAELGWEQIDATSTAPIGGAEGYRFMGTNARGGLVKTGEEVFDLTRDYSQLSITYADGKTLDGNDHSRFTAYEGPDKPYVFHARYFNTFKQVAHVENKALGTQGKALLVSDSYGGAITRPLAMQFALLDRSDDLFNGAKKRSFERTLAKEDYDTVVFVAHARDLGTAMHNSRRYFH